MNWCYIAFYFRVSNHGLIMPRVLNQETLYRIVFLWDSREDRPPSDRTYRWVGRAVGCHRNTVQEVLRRYRERGTPMIPPGNKVSHSIATTDQQDLQIGQLITEEPFLVPKEIIARLGLRCSVSTIKRRLRQLGLRGSIAARKPALTEKNKRDRLRWALDNRNRDWDKVAFSDECIISTSHNAITWVRRPKRARYQQRYIADNNNSGRVTISVWGLCHRGGMLELILVPKGLKNTSARYIAYILEPAVVPFINDHPDVIFQQDNSPIHTSHKCQDFLDENDIEVLDWPAKSPDASIIENLWATLKRNVGNLPSTIKRDGLWERVKTAWEGMRLDSAELLEPLYTSMPRRIEAIIAANGGSTKY